ncbi:protein-tyrosine phosphatase [Stigmatella aurantiaca]|uniref:Protein-tyrosine phosphatase n=1 Tax=Stigmatella aurantiaca TaxID=41 RepID=A0A1H8CJ14_STIAU|nr:tyrosine-protein phosphatase [Stigmatella aurantiaca]SEM94942.1 protein-tyrosine phosphatase [Stigmatella aurantiaca]
MVVHPFQRLSNFRDVGGLKTADGRTLRTGVLFRSDELSRLNAEDWVKLRGLGIQLICDLRSPGERQKRRLRLPDASIRVVNVPLHEQATQDGSRRKLLGFLFGKTGGERFREFSRAYYHHIAFEQTARIREVITLLAGEQSLPAVIHCTAGKDRTGFLAALVQLLAGVRYEAVMEDYLRTNDYFALRLEKFIRVMRVLTLAQVSPERMRLILMAHPDFLDEVHGTLMKRYGSVETYLREACGIEQDTLRKLKDRLLA